MAGSSGPFWRRSREIISFCASPPAVSSPQAATAGPPSRRAHHFRDAGLEYVLAVPAGSIQRLTAGGAAFKVSASSSFAASQRETAAVPNRSPSSKPSATRVKPIKRGSRQRPSRSWKHARRTELPKPNRAGWGKRQKQKKNQSEQIATGAP